MNIAICDDDPVIVEQIEVLLREYISKGHSKIKFDHFFSPLELISEIEKRQRYDVLFLDIIMPGVNGMSAAKEIRQLDKNLKIVFLTSSAEYAVESYRVNARDYQLKPVVKTAFVSLLDELYDECQKAEANSILIKSREGLTRVVVSQIEYCESINRKVAVVLSSGRSIECDVKLEELFSKLEAYASFIRPHRSYIVNMAFIRNISAGIIELESDVEIVIPHGKQTAVKEKYLSYIAGRKG